MLTTRPLSLAAVGLAILVLSACGGDKATGPSQGATPTISSVTPSTGTVGTELTIIGTNFRADAQVTIGTFQASSVEVANGTTIYAVVPTGVVADVPYAVRVQNTDATFAQLADAFTAVAPTLRFVNGATLPSGNVGSTVILEGLAFGDQQGPGKVLFSDGVGGWIAATIIDPANDWTNTFVVTTVPSGAQTGNLVILTGTDTSNALQFTVTTSATFSPSTITWAGTTALPVGISGHTASFAALADSSRVYVIGGAANDSVPTTTVQYAGIQAAGGLGTWGATTGLPTGRAFHAGVIATAANSRVLADSASIYVIGGATDAAGTPTATVYRGRLTASGTVQGWVATTALPVALHSLRAVIFRGEIYVSGGATTGNAPAAGVYRARIDSTGALGAWQTLPSLPTARKNHGFVVFGRFLYALGGATDSLNPHSASLTAGKTETVVYAAINLRTGALAQTEWTLNANSLTKATSKHTIVAAGGSAFMTAGLYNGANTGSSENSYATFNADGSLGSFAGATGSNTISSAGGGNLFNHAALSYVDAAGVARVLVIGGDDVNSPSTKRAATWYY